MRIEYGRLGLGTAPLAGVPGSVGALGGSGAAGGSGAGGGSGAVRDSAAVSDQEAEATLTAAWQRGVRYFDTAPEYGDGLAERRLGRFLSCLDRDGFVVSTKLGRDLSAAGVHRSVAASLERTGLDRIDLVLIHDVPAGGGLVGAGGEGWRRAVGEACAALAVLREEGAVAAVGLGGSRPDVLTRLVRDIDVDAVLVAGRYSLLDRGAADELLPACLERGVDVLVSAVFPAGVAADPAPVAHFHYGPTPEPVLARTRELTALARDHGVPLAALAVQFPLRHPAVRAVLLGARTGGEIEAAVDAASVPVPEELWERV